MKIEMYSKKVEEQIEILKNKGIIFKDEEKAKKIILRENFYNLTTDYDDIFLNFVTFVLQIAKLIL